MHKLIFLAEDDPDDAFLFREALRKVNPACALETAEDGQQMLDKLTHNSYQAPEVIVLDINMPGMDGMECLAALRKIPGLTDVPIVMFSTGADSQTISKAYTLGASFYAAKPNSFQQLIEVVDVIVNRKWPHSPRPETGNG